MVFTFSGVTVKLALRTFLAPFISGCLIVLATRIMFKERRYQSLPMATLGALSYSVIMVVISLFARYQITQGVVYYSILSVFLNSFIIFCISFFANDCFTLYICNAEHFVKIIKRYSLNKKLFCLNIFRNRLY